MNDDWARRAACWAIGSVLAVVLGAVAGWLLHPAMGVIVAVVVAVTIGWNIERMIERNRHGRR